MVARDDDTTFGILHSRFHELWSLRLCTWLGVERPALHADHLFETFPFPEALRQTSRRPTTQRPARQGHRRRRSRLNELRENLAQPARTSCSACRRSCRAIPTASCPIDDKAAAISRSARSPISTTSGRLARRRPPGPRRRRRRGLRLARRPQRRADPGAAVQAQPGARSGAVRRGTARAPSRPGDLGPGRFPLARFAGERRRDDVGVRGCPSPRPSPRKRGEGDVRGEGRG